jgi:hypothetical protein
MTAVELLITEIEKTDWWLIRKKIPLLVEQAKEMEKQQIINTYRDGRSDQQSEKTSRFYNRIAEQYYKETFKPQ